VAGGNAPSRISQIGLYLAQDDGFEVGESRPRVSKRLPN
jgi:hypothetical protein